MKNILTIVFTILILGSCGQSSEGPEDIAISFIDNIMSGSEDQAYALLSKPDQEYYTYEVFRETPFGKKGPFVFDTPASLLNKSFMEHTTYEVISTNTADNVSKVAFSITGVDVNSLIKEFMGRAMSSAFGGGDANEALADEMQDRIAAGDYPKTTIEWTMDLRQEVGVWRVFMDYALMDRLQQLTASAEEHERDENWEEAKSDYEELLELNSELVKAKSSIQELDQKIISARQEEERLQAENKIKQEYVQKIELMDFVATRIDTFMDKQIPAVSFRLKNGGDKSLKKVKVTVYFQDEDGSTIFEKSYNPILVSEYNFGDNEPLKAGYIWSMGNGKYYTIDDMPPEWGGTANAQITEIEFME